jgi:integrase
MAGRRRRFGLVRKLPSGKWQASFIGPGGVRQTAPETFLRRTDADRWLAQVESDICRGVWLDDKLGRVLFGDYARAYLRDNPSIGARWRETCERNMRLHMTPLLDRPLVGITPVVVREWHAAALRGSGGRTSIAQSYRFLRAVMYSAVRDGAVGRNPCQVPGAGADRAGERSVASPAEVLALVGAITPRYRAAVLLAAWCGLRRGEVCGLFNEDVDLASGTVWVRRTHVELLESPQRFDKDPKSAAGKRPVSIPPHVKPYLTEHAAEWAGAERFFVSKDGSPMRGNAVYQAFVRARTKVGLTGLSFHDLRHTGQTLAEMSGQARRWPT